MRMIILPVAALALISATDVDEKAVHVPDTNGTIALPFDNPSYVRTPAQVKLIERAQREATPSDEQCRNRITMARNKAANVDLPDREPASADKPYLISAVEKQIGGCAVLVMKGNAKDKSSLSAPAEGVPEITPTADADE